MKRTLVIADIHGGLEALKQVLQRAQFHVDNDTLIFLGDYVDGWSESAQLIEYLIDLQQYTTGNHIFLRGNHDAMCQKWLQTGSAHLVWTQNGGNSTMESYISTGLVCDSRHLKFFKKLKDYYVDSDNRAFVHGGFTSRKGVGHEPYSSNYYWDRSLWDLALMSEGRVHEELNLVKGIPHSRRFENHEEIYIGHSPTTNWNAKGNYIEHKNPDQILNAPITVPMNRCNVWNLDTGAGWDGKLTIMDINSKKYWQSDKVSELYPNEKGR